MKLIIPALVCLLLAGMWLQDVDTKSMHVPSSNCCYMTVKRKISPKKIRCYKHISSTCSHENRLIRNTRAHTHTPKAMFRGSKWIQTHEKMEQVNSQRDSRRGFVSMLASCLQPSLFPDALNPPKGPGNAI
uniref:C-C motif chemokine ligand 1 n=1 Tax=Capra hircus TaxID=9925 RepID=A0A8C2RRQ4_CAPHI